MYIYNKRNSEGCNIISACPMQAIGVTSSDTFPDNYFSATSSSGSNVASKGRLHGDGAWSPSTDINANDYLQIDLQYEFVICAVATQGKPTADEWTTRYKLWFSLIDSGDDWLTYQENNVDKVGMIRNKNNKNDTMGQHVKKLSIKC